MSEHKHTPGPWFSPDGKTIKQDYRRIGLSEAAGCMIGAVMGGPTSGPAFIEIAEEVAANTQLIAAAPDLLSIAKRWAALDCQWHPDRYESERAELLVDTNSAIAKATQ